MVKHKKSQIYIPRFFKKAVYILGLLVLLCILASVVIMIRDLDKNTVTQHMVTVDVAKSELMNCNVIRVSKINVNDENYLMMSLAKSTRYSTNGEYSYIFLPVSDESELLDAYNKDKPNCKDGERLSEWNTYKITPDW